MKIKTGDGIIIFLATPSTPPTSIIRSRLRCLHVMPRAARQHPVGGRITSCSILHSNHRAHHPLLFACLFALYVTGHTEKCFSILKNLKATKSLFKMRKSPTRLGTSSMPFIQQPVQKNGSDSYNLQKERNKYEQCMWCVLHVFNSLIIEEKNKSCLLNL